MRAIRIDQILLRQPGIIIILNCQKEAYLTKRIQYNTITLIITSTILKWITLIMSNSTTLRSKTQVKDQIGQYRKLRSL